MPEWLTRQDRENGSWTIEAGQAVRGDAWTNATERRMRVPIGDDATNRVIRAHEMMHAKVSPLLANIGQEEEGLPADVLRAAEEMRVNLLVKAAGFDTDLLVDGSERQTGERLAQARDYAGLVTMLVAVAGTKGSTAFLRGVRNIDPELAKALREVEKGALKYWKGPARRRGEKRIAQEFGSTEPTNYFGSPIPTGYEKFTLPVARFIATAIDAIQPPPEGDAGEGVEPIDTAADRVRNASKAASGRFAPLRLDNTVTLDRSLSGRMGRKRIATNMGRNPRRLNRMLTDPQRRVFDRTIRGTGGVVVIDQSGSMHLSGADVKALMEASPGCTIIGYSHRPGSTDTPNTWVIAKDGRCASEFPSGHGGNGVDGPALRYALSLRRRGEPVVWVCDGAVTDGKHDHTFDNLSNECALLVHRNNVHMVANVDDGVRALQEVAAGRKLPTKFTGPLRYAAEGLGLR